MRILEIREFKAKKEPVEKAALFFAESHRPICPDLNEISKGGEISSEAEMKPSRPVMPIRRAGIWGICKTTGIAVLRGSQSGRRCGEGGLVEVGMGPLRETLYLRRGAWMWHVPEETR